MPTITPEQHQRVLKTLDAALDELSNREAKVEPVDGFVAFKQIRTRLEQTRFAIEGSSDAKQIANRLKNLYDSVITRTGESVTPVTDKLLKSLKPLIAELDPPK